MSYADMKPHDLIGTYVTSYVQWNTPYILAFLD